MSTSPRELNPPPATRVVLFWLSQPPRLTDLGLMKRRYRSLRTHRVRSQRKTRRGVPDLFGLCESAADAQPLSPGQVDQMKTNRRTTGGFRRAHIRMKGLP